MIKTKEIHTLNKPIDGELNSFLSKGINLVDIKFTTELDMHGLHRFVLVIYEE